MDSKILLRDNLNDNGSIPSIMNYSSPDIISHSQVSDPLTYFSQNYTTDPNEPVGIKNDNYVYVRVKNIGNTASDPVYVNLYANHLSLYMDPKKWANNRVPTIGKNLYSKIDALSQNAIGVTKDYFLFDYDKYKNACFVAVAGEEKNPDFSNINSWSKYVEWVTTNTNVGTRNMRTYTEKDKRHYENYLNLSNPYGTKATFIISVEANSKVPAGTTFGIESDAFGISESKVYSESCKGFKVTTDVNSGMDDYIRFYGTLANESSQWPVDAAISVSAILVMFGMDAEQDQAELDALNSENCYRSAKYYLTPEDMCIPSKTKDTVVNLAVITQGAPVFGLRVGACGIRYI